MAEFETVNLRAIAKAVGVSHTTVSRALRGEKKVSEQTRQRVWEAAERLGYRNNPVVQAYASHIRRIRGGEGPSCNLAWLRSYRGNEGKHFEWQRPLFEGAVARASELGYHLDTGINALEFTDTQLDRLMDARGIRGVFLPFNDYVERRPYQREQFVTVALGESPDAMPMHTVAPAYFKNTTAAIDHLLAAGYRRIGLCEHSHGMVLDQGAVCGAYRFHQLRLPEAQHLEPLLGVQVSDVNRRHEAVHREVFLRWLDRTRPDAILVTFWQAMDWLEHAGIQVPDELGLAHLGLSPREAGWSGVAFNDAAIGAAGVDLLTAHIQRNQYGFPHHPQMLRLAGVWQNGWTTRPAPLADSEHPASLCHSMEWYTANVRGFLGTESSWES